MSKNTFPNPERTTMLVHQKNDAQKIIKAIAEGDLGNIRTAVVEAMGGIHQAFGGNQSHWFECVNGHPYYIDSCGGAMETSKCPECGSVIGGADHNLAAGNRHADAMVTAAGVQVASEETRARGYHNQA